MANYVQLKFMCECGEETSKLILRSSQYDQQEYPECCDKPMEPQGVDSRNYVGHYVMDDIQPYKSTMDGSMISSRSKHRQHLQQHGVIEVGNEDMSKHIKPPEYNKGDLREQLKHNLRTMRR